MKEIHQLLLSTVLIHSSILWPLLNIMTNFKRKSEKRDIFTFQEVWNSIEKYKRTFDSICIRNVFTKKKKNGAYISETKLLKNVT